jgi:serine/threonine protein kinase
MCSVNCPRCEHRVEAHHRFCGRCGLARPLETEMKDPLLGRVLGDRYRVESRIAKGGMGAVYLASHVGLGNKVAIKVLRDRMVDDPQFLQRFENEAQNLARLVHPNLVSLHDYGLTPDGTPYTVLEYCPGVPLSRFVKPEDPVSSEVAADIAIQIAQGLAVVHEAGIVHRDLKPDNVLLMELRPGRYHVKLLDFGIAKCLEDEEQGLTQAGMVFGTPEYMSPEQARGEAVDARTDLYALGCILYELLSGRTPFMGENKMNVMHQQAVATPEPLLEVAPPGAVPEAMAKLVSQSLEKRREARFPDALRFIEALEHAVSMHAPLAPRPAATRGERVVSGPDLPSDDLRLPSDLHPPATDGGPVPTWVGGDFDDEVEQPLRVRPTYPAPRLVAVAAVFCLAILGAAFFFSADGDDSADVATAEVVDDAEAVAAENAARVEAEQAAAERVAAEEAAAERAAAERAAAEKAAAAAEQAAAEKAAADKAALVRKAADEKARQARLAKEKAAAAEKAAKEKRATAIAGARNALRRGKLDAATRGAEQVLAAVPGDAQAKAIKDEVGRVRAALADGRRAFENADCVRTLRTLEPVLEVAPGARGVSHMVNSCRESLPPRHL